MSTAIPSAAARPARGRALSAAELLLGALLVIGHNVFGILPNEVPILFVLGWVSLRLRDGGFRAIGLTRPESWPRTVAIALAAAATRVLLGSYVVEPLAQRIWRPAVEAAEVDELRGNVMYSLLALAFVWAFAGFGEELGYRGYLLTRAADLGGRTQAAYWLALVPVSVLFGYGHYYKGPAGMVESGIAGFILGAAYLLAQRNFWVPILAHGFIDSFGVMEAFLGWE